MKISELPQDLRELAEKRRAEQNPPDYVGDDLVVAFSWRQADEGVEFWFTANAGHFDEARKLLNQ